MILRHSHRVVGACYGTCTTQLSRRTFAQPDDRWCIAARPVSEEPKPEVPRTLDTEILKKIQSLNHPRLNTLFAQYSANTRLVLHATLSCEPNPPPHRRISFDPNASEVVLVAHAVDIGSEHKISFCSGFALKTDHGHGINVIISCAHTLEELGRHRLLNLESEGWSASLIIRQHNRGAVTTADPGLNVLTSLPRSDVVLFSTDGPSLPTLPFSPYPARVGTRIRAHFVSEIKPADDSGWSPWIHGTWCKWVQGEVLGYRDFAGHEAKPGTYDSLSHLLFNPPPSPGSSGGPIVDEETGSVIGIIIGSRMNNHVEGVRGWGVPSEVIYEMFRLPGLDLDA